MVISFEEPGSSVNYFREFGEQAHSFWVKGALQISKNINLKNITLNEKTSFF